MRTSLTPDGLAQAQPARTPSGRAAIIASGVAAAAGLAIFIAERRWPLRRQTQDEPNRLARNLAMGAMSMAVVNLVENPVVLPIAARAEKRRSGLVQQLPGPAWARDAAAILLLDYTIYFWHVATHRVPWLWRLHLVHHLDLDLDATSALRFHAADMAVSTPYRAAQVALIGASPRALKLWQSWFFLSVLFHHSNVRLPLRLERLLARLITTPRMHGIHHSAVREETDSNWSSGLSVWDHLHGSFRLDPPQQELSIGVPAYRQPAEIALMPSLRLPFVRQRDAWTLQPGAPAAPLARSPVDPQSQETRSMKMEKISPPQLSRELRLETSDHLRLRRIGIGLSFAGAAIGALVGAYQTGLISRLPDILPGDLFDAEKVDASNYAYENLQMPDGPQMVINYGITAALIAAGGKDRATQAPALPIAAASKTIFDFVLCVSLGVKEWRENKAFCSWCQLATLISAVSVAITLPEAIKAARSAT